MIKPEYYKVIWHNCGNCKTHFTSEAPHLTAYLCNDCWRTLPHFSVKTTKKPDSANVSISETSWSTIALYTLGNLCCLAIIGYYLWLK